MRTVRITDGFAATGELPVEPFAPPFRRIHCRRTAALLQCGICRPDAQTQGGPNAAASTNASRERATRGQKTKRACGCVAGADDASGKDRAVVAIYRRQHYHRTNGREAEFRCDAAQG